ncbi:Protein CSN12 [Pleurostoma richardsiae]|uniref:Protein CSN12 homolog n=1 Tax=Pleurostoma richardsiae TaxID=41990 RepID=A0AA38RA37_9PEZI|nr:Protein CSN12 [Pleurostoma richardsiae]
MDFIFQDFGAAIANYNGHLLGQSLSPELPPETLDIIWRSTNYHDAHGFIRRNLQSSASTVRLSQQELEGWTQVYLHYWKTVGEILAIQGAGGANGKPSWKKVYESWKEMASLLIRGYQSHGFEAWTIPCLYVSGKYLRVFAIKADDERNSSTNENGGPTFQDDFDPETEKHQQLEDCARHLNRFFTLCLNDRAPLEESRKWGIFFVINLLFKTYFKLNQASLSRNILKALNVYRGDMPALDAFPKSQQVTFKYYEGVLSFLEENYVEAEKQLTQAWSLCHKDAKRNKELILTYLIPCHLITNHTLPSPALLEPYPRLQTLFSKLSRCIKRGELHAFDLALQEGEDEFVKRRIYLTLERGRDIALRNLLRRVYIVGGFEEPKEPGAAPIRRTRIPIQEFEAAISIGTGQQLDRDEVECLLANMIYKNLMKGYIAREKGFVVLSKSGAFPGTGV